MLVFDKELNTAINQHLDASKKSIRLIFFSISPPSPRNHKLFADFWHALEKAILRVPDSQIILSGWPNTNPQATATYRSALLLASYGAKVKIGKAGRMIHPKAACFDDNLLIVGSHNATEAGFTRTQNISYIGSDVTEIGQFNDYFQKQWGSIPFSVGEH